MQKRPKSVTVIGILAIIGGAIGVLGALAEFAAGAFFAGYIGGSQGVMTAGILAVQALVSAVSAAAQIAAGVGLLAMKRWAWLLSITLVCINTGLEALHFAQDHSLFCGMAIGVLIDLYVLSYLLSYDVKQAFGRIR